MIKAFVFDVGNVVWVYKPLNDELFSILAKSVNLSFDDFFKEYLKIYIDLETDKSNLVDWLKTLNPEITSKLVDSQLESVFGDSQKFTSYFNNDVISLIKKIKSQGFPVLCLSNTENYFYPYMKKYIVPFFDHAILSWQVKDRKPNPSIYQNIFNYGDWQPNEVVFVDDRLENVAAAQMLGINGILFENYPQLEKDISAIQK